ncbi:glycoside hydrolase family 16 protein [Lyophyllum atratum]|nr:glycoside hydrolase family 16 protein [Lyophyllum atratum]
MRQAKTFCFVYASSSKGCCRTLVLTALQPTDALHNPNPRRDRKHDRRGTVLTVRGLTNLGCLILLGVGLVALFAGYPLVSHFTSKTQSLRGGFNLGGINATGQIPSMAGNWGLIDLETPRSAYTKPSYQDPSEEMQLVFSDEFNTDGRSFYPGDDPYWEAVDLHYWATNNMEWYDPAAITTKDGALEITLSKKETHGLHRWPYTYDSCDVGTVANQTVGGLPIAATVDGDITAGGSLSFLPGQRLSRCTCPGESHPGPLHADGTFVGRSAPEIDIFESQVTGKPLKGQVSQSAQWAPISHRYLWKNTSDTTTIADPNITMLNPYLGGAFQQATSAVTEINQDCYELLLGCSSIYGFEYKSGGYGGYISWISDGKLAWTLKQEGMDADEVVEISIRPIPREPLYIIVNLGMSTNFGNVDLEHLTFPATMRVDWIRIYQRKNAINVGCDPKDFPTQGYINNAYTNANLTTWTGDFNQTFPKNSYLNQC